MGEGGEEPGEAVFKNKGSKVKNLKALELRLKIQKHFISILHSTYGCKVMLHNHSKPLKRHRVESLINIFDLAELIKPISVNVFFVFY